MLIIGGRHMNKFIVCFLLAMAMSLSRFAMPSHEASMLGAIEAFQHIGVGALFVLCFLRDWRPFAIPLLVVVTIQEGIMFSLFEGWL